MIRWSEEPEMRAWVERMCKKYTDDELTPMFMARFGVVIGDTVIKGMRKRYGMQTGRDGCFKPGQKPWCDGLRGKGVMKGNKASFKKGNRPHNWRPIGSERICSKDDILKVKISDSGRFQKDWQSKHSLIWEKHHGKKVPKGHVVMFADGNRRNFDINNLVLVHRRVNCMHNKRGYSKAPAELRPALLAVAQLDTEIKRKERKND